jgi:hypothetical protein
MDVAGQEGTEKTGLLQKEPKRTYQATTTTSSNEGNKGRSPPRRRSDIGGGVQSSGPVGSSRECRCVCGVCSCAAQTAAWVGVDDERPAQWEKARMLRLLYFSSLLSAWGNRMWEFAVHTRHTHGTPHDTHARWRDVLSTRVLQVPILLTSVFTDSLLPASAFPFFTQLSCVVFGALHLHAHAHTHMHTHTSGHSPHTHRHDDGEDGG